MKFTKMQQPLKFPVRCGIATVIPEGATGVQIAFRQSHLRRFDEDLGRDVPMNVYRYKGREYHA